MPLSAKIVALCLAQDPQYNVGVMASAASAGDTVITYSHMPHSPDNAITVYDTEGFVTPRLHRGGTTVDKPGISIHIRGQTYDEAEAIMEGVIAIMKTVYRRTVAVNANNHTIVAIHRRGTPVNLGHEADGRRQRFSLNAIASLLQEP